MSEIEEYKIKIDTTLEELYSSAMKFYNMVMDNIDVKLKESVGAEGVFLKEIKVDKKIDQEVLWEEYFNLIHQLYNATLVLYDTDVCALISEKYFIPAFDGECCLDWRRIKHKKIGTISVIDGFIMDGKSQYRKDFDHFDSEMDEFYRCPCKYNIYPFGIPEKYYFPIIICSWLFSYMDSMRKKYTVLYLDRAYASFKLFHNLPSKYATDRIQNDSEINMKLFMLKTLAIFTSDEYMLMIKIMLKEHFKLDFKPERNYEKILYKDITVYKHFFDLFKTNLYTIYENDFDLEKI